MSDTEDAYLTSRHVHNRSKGGKNSSTSSNGQNAFDVRKTFGTYELSCNALQKLHKGSRAADASKGTLDIFRLSEDGLAALAYIDLSPALRGNVILAASRKTMQKALKNVEALQDGLDTNSEGNDSAAQDVNEGVDQAEHGNDDSDDEQDEDKDEDEAKVSDDKPSDRFATFSKNSFRSPKFWLRWQGFVNNTESSRMQRDESNGSPSDVTEEILSADDGYIVFAGNDCRKFSATISCKALSWKNVAVKGWKIKSSSERNTAFEWQSR